MLLVDRIPVGICSHRLLFDVRNGRSAVRQSRYPGSAGVVQVAKDSLAAADVKHRITDWAKVPRGAIVYWIGGGSQYGHVAISVGDGYVLSTDWPTARVGRVHGGTLMNAWGYTEAFWSPIINDVVVWRRKPKAAKPEQEPKPKPRQATNLQEAIRSLGGARQHLGAMRRWAKDNDAPARLDLAVDSIKSVDATLGQLQKAVQAA